MTQESQKNEEFLQAAQGSEHERLKEVLALVNNKGGVGKTTTTVCLASALLRERKDWRILVIDLDSQCNASMLLGWSDKSKGNTVYEALKDGASLPVYETSAKNYGKEGAEIIVDNTQLTVFGGFAPNSETAQVLSKSLGTRTVMSGSVSQSKNDPSRSLQMIERPLMTADELKTLPKGTFIVTKTGFNPIKVKLKLFFKWGIRFEDKPYVVPLRDNKDIHYASKDTLMRSVYEKYSPDKKGEEEIPPGSYSVEQILGEKNYPESEKNARHGGRAVLHSEQKKNPEKQI